MCALKLFRKLARVEILTNVSQPLFQFEESFLDVLLVGEGDVAPHRVRTRRDACHFAQGTSSGRQQWSVFSELIHQRRSESRGDHLRQRSEESRVGKRER